MRKRWRFDCILARPKKKLTDSVSCHISTNEMVTHVAFNKKKYKYIKYIKVKNKIKIKIIFVKKLKKKGIVFPLPPFHHSLLSFSSLSLPPFHLSSLSPH
jgi:hypothetical protein